MKDTGVIRKIDELGRIVIPKEIRKNLNIRNGEDVQIYVEEDRIVLKKYQKILSISENAQKYIDQFSKFLNSEIIITDREHVIASSVESYLSEELDFKVLSLINDRRQEKGYGLKIGGNIINKNYYIHPVIVDADAIGSIILMNSNVIEEKEKLVCEILNTLLSSLLC